MVLSAYFSHLETLSQLQILLIGIPIEYQRIYSGDVELSSDSLISSSDDLRLMVALDGGDPHFSTSKESLYSCKLLSILLANIFEN
jgi:hypothetical protein